jgi:hypothetical protein
LFQNRYKSILCQEDAYLKVNLAQPTVSHAILRGQKISEDLGLSFRSQLNQQTNGRYILSSERYTPRPFFFGKNTLFSGL